MSEDTLEKIRALVGATETEDLAAAVEKRIQGLLEYNNRTLERARKAEAEIGVRPYDPKWMADFVGELQFRTAEILRDGDHRIQAAYDQGGGDVILSLARAMGLPETSTLLEINREIQSSPPWNGKPR